MAWSDLTVGAPAMPALLGAELSPYPYISGYGVLRRIVRLGLLARSEVAALGLRSRCGTNILLATQQPGAVRRKLIAALGVPSARLADYWSAEIWSPFDTGGALDREVLPIRECPQCAAYGYHCAAFQVPSLTRCPWHDEELSPRCTGCGQPRLAAFRSRGVLGRCACGHDSFDPSVASVGMWSFPTQDADEWATGYLEDALAQRTRRRLVVPSNTAWTVAYAALARPAGCAKNPRHSVLEVEHFDRGKAPQAQDLWAWSAFGGDRQLALLPLPGPMYSKLTSAALRVARELPDGTPTPPELVMSHALAADESLATNISARPECFIAPHGQSQNRATWINASALAPNIVSLCGELIDTAIASSGQKIDLAARSLQVARSEALERIAGLGALVAALESLVSRAYAHGLHLILQSYSRHPLPQRPGWQMPFVEIVIGAERIDAVRVCWVVSTPPRVVRSVDAMTPVSRKRGRPKDSSKLRPTKKGQAGATKKRDLGAARSKGALRREGVRATKQPAGASGTP